MEINMNRPQKLSELLNTAGRKELADILRYFVREARPEELSGLMRCASRLREQYYGKKVYFRGLIEFSSYCKRGCYYCGLQRNNANAVRYRLSEDEILACCGAGRKLGFRTFVLQSGEDPYHSDERLCGIVSGIKARFPDCAVTLSVGERSRDSYRRLFEAGADRYLLRHETADEAHYGTLHPPEQTLKNRMRCLYDLKELGYQVGAGFMVDSPGQTCETLAEDFAFLRRLQPQMVGIGPFIPHKDTRFADYCRPSSEKTVILLALVRVLLPKVLLPATTALGTIDPLGREKAFQAGANVLMPNLSPAAHRKDYNLYDNKICMGEEAAECVERLSGRVTAAGFVPDFSRGDHVDWENRLPRGRERILIRGE
ncbi:MAG: [FeFe] hydrogenase H-cluster radical SAM maturase HydE [Clostridiales bacterium]|nr:[FeFe] hydrogenase H-cluster radical SAM maturase HydE [Clostridiales bacterium]